jgi:hypothetical protein
VKIAPAKGWPEGAKPQPASGFTVTAFATDLDHRTLLALPNSDVLVAETNAPERPEEGKGIKGFIYQRVQSWAGAGVKSPNRITLVRDADGDGVVETRNVFLKDLYSPFGMTPVGGNLYIADSDAVMTFPYSDGATQIDQPGKKLADLPAGPLNHHWTKGLTASEDGSKLYASIGRTATPRRTDWTRKRGGPQSVRSTFGPARGGNTPPVCAMRWRLPPSRKPRRSGRWSTSVTSLAAIWCRTTSLQ